MSPLMALKIAARSLAKNSMRSALTMLGVVIGVGAVITMVAVGQGAKAQIEDRIASVGSNLLMIFPKSTAQGRMGAESRSGDTLTYADALSLGEELSSVRLAAPSLRTVARVVSTNQNWSTDVTGSTPAFFQVRNWTIALGRPFTQSDVSGSTKVAVLGTTVSSNLFGTQDPVGQIIRIRNVPFRVIGVLASKGESPMGQDQDDIIVIPLFTLQKRIMGTTRIGGIFALSDTPQKTEAAERDIQVLLRQRHGLTPDQDDDFSIHNMSDIASMARTTSRIMTLLLGSIASVSLIVGGIGIMNIMLVSVTERTREIGIRLAVGARKRDILLQFLIEAVLLSFLGGLLGIALGMISSKVVSAFVQWPTVVSVGSILQSFTIAIAIGIFFGLYPARRAARLDPIEALRYE